MMQYARTRGPLEEWVNVEIYPQDQCKRVPISEMQTPAQLMHYLGMIEDEGSSYIITLYIDQTEKEYADWTEVIETLRRNRGAARIAIRTASISDPSDFIHWMQETT